MKATFGGGCFWCTEVIFQNTEGVKSVLPGYMGGLNDNPTYEQVCTGTTEHVEVVQIEYDEDLVNYEELLKIFFKTHNPTTLNRQGNDVGTQYRSGIYCYDSEQTKAAKQTKSEVAQQLKKLCYPPISTEIIEAPTFYYAEDYHQQYLHKNPNGYCGLKGTGIVCTI